MKTAMQELIEYLEVRDRKFTYTYKKAIELLEKEKEQIRTSYGQGRADSFSMPSKYASGTDYYNQTYLEKEVGIICHTNT